MTERSIENALRVLLAVGGSTNALIHLTAIAGRAGIKIDMGRLNQLSDATPVLIDLKPTGTHYMEDFNAAGGVPALLHELKDQLHLDCLTVTGETLGERLGRPVTWVDREVIRTSDNPINPVGGLVAVFGNLSPRGAILKRSAADPNLFEQRARAVVFESLDDLATRIDDPALDVHESDILILKNAGPASDSAMPEAGYIPIPSKLARAGVKDMLRISDARMSGTAFGTIVLHVAPDAASGGTIGLVRTGDMIRLSISEKRLEVELTEHEILLRRSQMPSRAPSPTRGYSQLYNQHILQADEGCDFDFLRHPAMQNLNPQ